MNLSKGDLGPGQWTPPARSYRCTCVAEYIAVKWRWRLSIDSFERATLRGLLNYCDQERRRAHRHTQTGHGHPEQVTARRSARDSTRATTLATADRPGTLGTHVIIEWDRLLPIPERIPCERLAHQVPAVNWAGTYRDVLEVPTRSGTSWTGCGRHRIPAWCTYRAGCWATPWTGRAPWPVTSAGC